jgi:hypothetical protein
LLLAQATNVDIRVPVRRVDDDLNKDLVRSWQPKAAALGDVAVSHRFAAPELRLPDDLLPAWLLHAHGERLRHYRRWSERQAHRGCPSSPSWLWWRYLTARPTRSGDRSVGESVVYCAIWPEVEFATWCPVHP